MRRSKNKLILYLLAALLIIVIIPKSTSIAFRGFFMSVMSPFWGAVSSTPKEGVEQLRLQAENQLLHNELEYWQELYQQEHDLNAQLAFLHDLEHTGHKAQELEQFLKPQLEAIPARVIFRSPNTWSSSLWINVGSKDNELLGKNVITKNSPVVIGSSVVGVIDYVGKRQSRVRLITDSAVAPSVRAVRGQAQNRRLLENIASLKQEFRERFPDNSHIQGELDAIEQRLAEVGESWYLAKGEVRGSSEPLWRAPRSLLQGIGFNYDFPDQYGPARDLRTGEVIAGEGDPVSILEEDDLLITTGMDGIFPPGLRVGRVTRVELLQEGDYYYELQAVPTVGNLNELTLVFVIPPQGFDREDQPPINR
jgi:cell shape-determining protein MreC